MEEANEKIDYLSFQRKVNTLMGMPFHVHSPKILGQRFGRCITAFNRYFTEVIVIILTIAEFWAVPHVSEDMNVLCGCLASGTHTAQVAVKTAFLGCYKNRFVDHLERIQEVQKDIDDFELSTFHRHSTFLRYQQKQSKYINVILTIQLVVNVASTLSYFLPFVYDSIINHEDVQDKFSPIVVYIGTDFNYTPLFQVVIIVLTLGFYVINLKTFVIDNFILSLVVLHRSQLKYLTKLLKEVVGKEDSGTGVVSVDERVMKMWIKQHQALLSLCENFRQLVSPYLFLEFSYVLMHTCVPAFVITSTFSWTLPQKIAVFFIIGCGLIELFVMSNAGDVISDAWGSTGYILFESELFFKNGKWMKDAFLMVQKRLQRPFRLAAFNIVPLNCATFLLILRLIFSYYMTLNQVQKMKHNDREESNMPISF